MCMGGTSLWYNLWGVEEQLDSHYCVSVIQRLSYLTEQQQMWSTINCAPTSLLPIKTTFKSLLPSHMNAWLETIILITTSCDHVTKLLMKSMCITSRSSSRCRDACPGFLLTDWKWWPLEEHYKPYLVDGSQIGSLNYMVEESLPPCLGY